MNDIIKNNNIKKLKNNYMCFRAVVESIYPPTIQLILL